MQRYREWVMQVCNVNTGYSSREGEMAREVFRRNGIGPAELEVV